MKAYLHIALAAALLTAWACSQIETGSPSGGDGDALVTLTFAC